MKKKKSFRLNTILALFGFIMIGTGSWALYSLVNKGAGDLLSFMGVTNTYLQLTIVILVVFVGLVLSGANVFKAINKIIKK